jgi:uncharacterized protein (DUF1684 family)
MQQSNEKAILSRMAFVRSRPVLACVLAAGVAACSGPELNHDEEIAAWRAEKDRFMRESSESPVIADRRASFAPLPYFPIAESYRIPAALERIQTQDIIEMSTSTNQRRRMRRIGTLKFTLKGQALQLTAFVDEKDTDVRRLFVPFHDLTNGTETYPGGRYLDLDRTATGIYDLDFNRAYHPFCVFNPQYECPVPPRENRLQVPIRAGEKLTTS